MNKVRRKSTADPSTADPSTADSSTTDQSDLLGLDRQLCFALYAASRAITRLYRERLEPLGLTYPQYLVLLVLYEQGGLTISEIGHRLMLDSGTLTPLVKRMATKGIIRRERSKKDEREVQVWLDARGFELRADLLDARKSVAQALGMSEIQIAELRAELMGLVNQLDCMSANIGR